MTPDEAITLSRLGLLSRKQVLDSLGLDEKT